MAIPKHPKLSPFRPVAGVAAALRRVVPSGLTGKSWLMKALLSKRKRVHQAIFIHVLTVDPKVNISLEEFNFIVGIGDVFQLFQMQA